MKCLEKNHPERAEFFRQFVTDKAWSGKVAIDEAHLSDPLSWQKPQIVAVGYHGDIALLTATEIMQIFNVMKTAVHHTYLLLTKRPDLLADLLLRAVWSQGAAKLWRHVWIGTSISNQAEADERLRWLRRLALAGWNAWISHEPATGPVDWEAALNCNDSADDGAKTPGLFRWLVAGGESGKGARSAHPDWFRAARDACAESGIPFMMKQWGEWGYFTEDGTKGKRPAEREAVIHCGENGWMERVGKKAAGHLLDGQVWQQTPWEGR